MKRQTHYQKISFVLHKRYVIKSHFLFSILDILVKFKNMYKYYIENILAINYEKKNS